MMRIQHTSTHSLPLRWVLLIFLALAFPYHYGFRFLSLTDSILYSLVDGCLFTVLVQLVFRHNLLASSLCYLIIPSLIFAAGWLHWPLALLLVLLVSYSGFTLAQKIPSPGPLPITAGTLLVVVILIAWVNISGIGGFGMQWPDYEISNARMLDLVNMPWPLRYGENRNLVYYPGYFLPSALLGKFTSVDIALRSQFYVALLGCLLALRWLSQLTTWRLSWLLALALILFGPLDLANMWYIKWQQGAPFQEVLDNFHNNDQDTLAFTTGIVLHHFIGSYPSLTFQLFWSPQQLIAGWLVAAIITWLYQHEHEECLVFMLMLLAVWGALATLALLPFIALLIVFSLRRKSPVHMLDKHTLPAAAVLALVFGFFYAGNNLQQHPSIWFWQASNWGAHLDLLLMFFLCTWGAYGIVLLLAPHQEEARYQQVTLAALLALLVLPLRLFGEWSDLLCRGSGALMFILLVLLLRSFSRSWRSSHKSFALALLLLFMIGSSNSLLMVKASLSDYGATQPVRSLLSFPDSRTYPNLGADDTAFNHWLRRAPASTATASP